MRVIVTSSAPGLDAVSVLFAEEEPEASTTEEAGHEEQAVTGQEESDQQPGLGEHDGGEEREAAGAQPRFDVDHRSDHSGVRVRVCEWFVVDGRQSMDRQGTARERFAHGARSSMCPSYPAPLQPWPDF